MSNGVTYYRNTLSTENFMDTIQMDSDYSNKQTDRYKAGLDS